MNDNERNQQDHDAIVTILEKVTAMETHMKVLNSRTAKNEGSIGEHNTKLALAEMDRDDIRERTEFWGKVLSSILLVIALIEAWAKFGN